MITYKQLELGSSNLLIGADAKSALDENLAKTFRLQAGRMREKMGDIKLAENDYIHAAEDFCSAWNCYIKADCPELGNAVYQKAYATIQKIPDETTRLWLANELYRPAEQRVELDDTET